MVYLQNKTDNINIIYMKKIFLLAVSALILVSCGNSYISKYEDVCEEAKEQIESANSVEELLSVVKQFRTDIRELSNEYAEEAEMCKKPATENKKQQKLYERRVKAHNSVSKAAVAKKRELKKD
jgi:PBP1b-binding outer membrane lipoprotein LpoB